MYNWLISKMFFTLCYPKVTDSTRYIFITQAWDNIARYSEIWFPGSCKQIFFSKIRQKMSGQVLGCFAILSTFEEIDHVCPQLTQVGFQRFPQTYKIFFRAITRERFGIFSFLSLAKMGLTTPAFNISLLHVKKVSFSYSKNQKFKKYKFFHAFFSIFLNYSRKGHWKFQQTFD